MSDKGILRQVLDMLADHVKGRESGSEHRSPSRLDSSECSHPGSEEMKFEIGKKLAGRYHLQEALGMGTYGQVWKAWDEQMARHVAIKVLHANEKAFERLHKEGIVGGGLSHKNVVNIFDFNPEEGFLVMEFVEGKSLNEILIERRKASTWITYDETAQILWQCLEAVEHTHHKQRVHGDIKPANILISEGTNVKLTDFGVAKILSDTTAQDSPKGSVTYSAPEVILGERGAPDFQSDLFSLGMVAYLMLAKNHPFADSAALEEIPERIVSHDFAPAPPSRIDSRVPRKLDDITMRLLEKDRSKRYRNSRQALDDLESNQPQSGIRNGLKTMFLGRPA